MKFFIVPVTPFQQNCSVICCEKTNKAAVVDPGGDLPQIMQVIKKQGLILEKILITHGHMDHCSQAKTLSEQENIPIEGPHKEDDFWIQALPQMCEQVGFPPGEPFTPSRWLNDGDVVTVGEVHLEVLHCPGHTPGHVVFFYRPAPLAIVGDVLFQGSIGRTDFPRGDHQQLIKSIKSKLWPLGDNVMFIPGHGPTSTFGQERQHNPFVSDSQFA